MLIAIYGGSFNPIHYGHTGLAAWVAANTAVDEVWLMVSPNNPLKPSSMLADEQVRLRAAQEEIKRLQEEGRTEGIERVKVSDFEFVLPRPSYTANTLRCLQERYPEHRFALLIGQDNWCIRKQWKEWESIEKNHPIYIYPRGKEGTSEIRAEINKLDGEIHLLEQAPLFNISSTELRKRNTN